MDKKLLHYSLQGSGHKTVVLLHGFCESKSIWEHLIPTLSNNFKVISIDLPGFGGSDVCQSTPSIEYFAKEVQQLLVHLKISYCTLVGHSLGGYVALAFAEMYPQYLQGLVLFHSSAIADSEDKKVNRNKTIEFVKTHGAAAFVATLIPSLFKESNRKHFATTIAQLVAEAATIAPQAIIDASIAMRDRTDRTQVLKEIKVPVLYIVGKADEAIPLKISLEQCHIAPLAYAYFLSESGHMGMVEETNNCSATLSQFILICQK
jgi:pimeloyl-ACP methyl ester carboxylesterase